MRNSHVFQISVYQHKSLLFLVQKKKCNKGRQRGKLKTLSLPGTVMKHRLELSDGIVTV